MKIFLHLVFLLSFVSLTACSQQELTPDPTTIAQQTEIGEMKVEISNLETQKSSLDSAFSKLLSATPKIIFHEITPTFTPTPKFTPTITLTPTITSSPTKTPDPLKAPKKDGFYLVGVDIAPGVWRSDGSGDSCYWEVSASDGDILANHFGMSGGTAYIAPNAFQVRFEDCGTWTFIQDP